MIVKIADLGDIVTGKTPSTKDELNFGYEYPFITPGDLQSTKHILRTERALSQSGAQLVKNCILPPNSICVSCIGNFGYIGKTTRRSVTNQQINSIIVKNEYDSDFVYYLMKSLWPLFKHLEGQSTTLSILNKTLFSNIEVDVPAINAQRFITATLSCLDDKIELNNRIIANLEAQAQAIFKSWFVDFEPFQDGEFEDSELGMIPKGWRVGTLDEIMEILDNKRIPLSGQVREKMQKIYPYYGAATLMDYVDDYIFDGIYLLLGEDGTVVDANGYPVLQYIWGKFWVNNHAHILQGKSGFSTEALYILLKNTSVNQIVTGAVQAKISQGNLKSITILKPNINCLSKYCALIEPLFASIRELSDENNKLTIIRDTLLPKLMSGEIEVPINF